MHVETKFFMTYEFIRLVFYLRVFEQVLTFVLAYRSTVHKLWISGDVRCKVFHA
jgi:hypothetical protein